MRNPLNINITSAVHNISENVLQKYSSLRNGIATALPSRKHKKSENEILIDNIIEARSELERAEHAFNEFTDHAAIDYASYSIMAAKARYVYLLGIAKKNNIKF